MPREVNPGYVRQFVDLFTVLDGPVTAETFTNPLAAVVDRFVASTNMIVGNYVVANAAAADGYAHLVYLVRTVTNAAADTAGTVTVYGTDNEGNAISDVMIPGANGVTVKSVKAFKTVTQVTGAGWVINGADPDTITLGMAIELGLAHAAAADADILTVYDAASLAATAAFTGKGNGTVAGTYFTPTGANGVLDYTAIYRRVNATTLLSNAGATLATSTALGFVAHVESFGFRVKDALAGAGGTLTFTLCTANGDVIATLVVALAAGGAGAIIETTVVDSLFTRIADAGTLVLKRTAAGTAFTSGSGTFYARLAQRPQARL